MAFKVAGSGRRQYVLKASRLNVSNICFNPIPKTVIYLINFPRFADGKTGSFDSQVIYSYRIYDYSRNVAASTLSFESAQTLDLCLNYVNIQLPLLPGPGLLLLWLFRRITYKPSESFTTFAGLSTVVVSFV